MDNVIPSGYSIQLFPGNDKYDFFFKKTDGFYGCIIDNKTFRYCKVVDFDKLAIYENYSDLKQFCYTDENTIYTGTYSKIYKLNETK